MNDEDSEKEESKPSSSLNTDSKEFLIEDIDDKGEDKIVIKDEDLESQRKETVSTHPGSIPSQTSKQLSSHPKKLNSHRLRTFNNSQESEAKRKRLQQQ